MGLVQEAITRIRNLRAEAGIPPSKKGELYLGGAKGKELEAYEGYFKALASISEVQAVEEAVEGASQIVLEDLTLYLPLDELIDYNKELQRFQEELKKTQSEIQRSQGKLSNAGFVDKAPQALVEKEREKLEGFRALEKELEEKIRFVKEKLQ